MNTRTHPIIAFALLAALPALRVLAQQPAAPAPAAAEATATPPQVAPVAATVTETQTAADAPASAAPAATPADPAAPAAPAGVAIKGKDVTGRDTLSVDFPHPRNYDMLTSPPCLELKRQIYHNLHTEVHKAMAAAAA